MVAISASMVAVSLLGFIAGLGLSPLLYVGYSALYSTAEAVNQDVEASEGE